MIIYNDTFSWEGFGGKLRLASGKCWLKIFDLSKDGEKDLAYIRPLVVIVTDVAGSDMSVRSCSSHLATMVSKEFKINPHRMLFIEYSPSKTYGEKKKNTIPATYEVVDFAWHDGKALKPTYRRLASPMLEKIKELNKES